jgi:hypothetical protein
MKKNFKHYGVVIGGKCRDGLGFRSRALFRESYVKDTGGLSYVGSRWVDQGD